MPSTEVEKLEYDPSNLPVPLPPQLEAARESLSVLAQVVMVLDSLREQNKTDIGGLTYLRVVLRKMVTDLKTIDSAAEGNIIASMDSKDFHVEGLGLVEKSSGTEWDNSQWNMEYIVKAIARRVDEAWQQGEVNGPGDAARLAAEMAFKVGGATLRVTPMKNELGVDPYAVGERKQSKVKVSVPKI